MRTKTTVRKASPTPAKPTAPSPGPTGSTSIPVQLPDVPATAAREVALPSVEELKTGQQERRNRILAARQKSPEAVLREKMQAQLDQGEHAAAQAAILGDPAATGYLRQQMAVRARPEMTRIRR
jgi:hypothetical protein